MPAINRRDLFVCCSHLYVKMLKEKRSQCCAVCPISWTTSLEVLIQYRMNQNETTRLLYSKGSITHTKNCRMLLPKLERHKWFILWSHKYLKSTYFARLQWEHKDTTFNFQIWGWFKRINQYSRLLSLTKLSRMVFPRSRNIEIPWQDNDRCSAQAKSKSRSSADDNDFQRYQGDLFVLVPHKVANLLFMYMYMYT